MNKLLFTEDSIIISKAINDIKQELLANKTYDFNCFFIDNQYRVYSKKSIGTMQINGFATNPICTNLQFIENTNFTTEIKMKSNFRFEYLLITLVFLFISIVLTVKSIELKVLFIPLIYLVTIFWFRMIYQNQEKKLHMKIKKFLLSIE